MIALVSVVLVVTPSSKQLITSVRVLRSLLLLLLLLLLLF